MPQFTNSIEYTDTEGSKVTLDGTTSVSTVDASTLSVTSAQEAQHAVNADNATKADAIKQTDTRSTNELPTFYYKKAEAGQNFTVEFKESAVIGLTGQSEYCQLQTYAKWTDSTGGNITQVAVVDDNYFIRTSTGSTGWGAWERLLKEGDVATSATNIFPDSNGAVNPLGRKADSDVGKFSTALGSNSTASGWSSTAIGSTASASGESSTALGYDAASGEGSTALGSHSAASGERSTALGYDAYAEGDYSIALGGYEHVVDDHGASAKGVRSIAIGSPAITEAGYSVALGYDSSALKSFSTALGRSTTASGESSTALGSNAVASGQKSTALGSNAVASGQESTALGNSSSASGNFSTAIGCDAEVPSTSHRTIQLGDANLSALNCVASLTDPSDKRDKTDIESITDALAFIERLTPVTFVRNYRVNYISKEDKQSETYRKYGMCEYDRASHAAGTKKGERRRCGLLAQEVVEAMQSVYGTDNYANIVNDNFHDLTEKPSDVENKYTLAYVNLVPFLIGAIKELNAKIKVLESKLATSSVADVQED